MSTSTSDLTGRMRALCSAPAQPLQLATAGGLFPGDVSYTIDPENANGNENHFQGVAALADGQHYVVTGSNWQTGRGDVFAFEVDAASRTGVCVAHAQIEAPLWHACGCDAWQDIVAVPAEIPVFTSADPGRFALRAQPPENTRSRSAVLFFQGPRLDPLPVRIPRPDVLATSVGFTRLDSGRYALVALAQPAPPAVQLDAYLTPGDDLSAGFQPAWSTSVIDGSFDNYDSITLLAAPGEVILAAFSGAAQGAVLLYHFPPDLSCAWTREPPIPVSVAPASFEAGACIALLPDGALALTAVSRYRSPASKKLVLTRLTGPAPSAPAPPLIAQAPIGTS